MDKVIWLTLAVLLVAGCAKSPPLVSALPLVVHYTDAQKDAINAERPMVAECCPNTDLAMEHYGKLRDKVIIGEEIQQSAK